MFVGGRIRIRLLNNTPSQREPVSTLHPLRGSFPLGRFSLESKRGAIHLLTRDPPIILVNRLYPILIIMPIVTSL